VNAVLRKLLLLLVPVALLATGACSSLADPPALTVNGAEISAEDVDAELSALQDNEQYRAIAESDCGGPSAGVAEGTFDSACVARLLTLRTYYELIEQDLKDRGHEISEDDLLAAREQLESDLPPSQDGSNPLEGFTQDVQDRLIRRYAIINALRDEVASEGAGDAEQQAFYEANKAQFEQACASHILASTDSQTPEEAKAKIDAIAARIAAGEPFADIATNESDDAAAAADAGALPCGPRGQFVPAFDDQVFSLPVNTLSAPVQTDFGWHLILVTSRETPTFEQVQPQIQQALQQDTTAAINAVLTDLTCSAKVTVDPRFGDWENEGCGSDTGEVARIVPPEGPLTTDTSLTPLP
jgi:parvulin-like peptidyl-prolyl isomerase